MYTYQNLLETDVRRIWSVCAGKCLRTWKEQLSRCDCQWAIWSFTWVPWVRFFLAWTELWEGPRWYPPEVLVTTTCAMVVRLRPEEQNEQRGWWFVWGRRLLMAVFLDDANMSEFMSEFLFQMTNVNYSWWCPRPSKMILSQEPGGGWILVLHRYSNRDKSGNFKMISEDRLTVPLPENGWLESFPFLFGMAYFQVLLLSVSGAVKW